MTAETEDNSKSRRLVMAPVENLEDETCRTFVFLQEDHTLGNALRHVIMKNPEVEFCGYSVPHPSENKINFRIQTKDKPASDVLKEGLVNLSSVCEHVLKTFEDTVSKHKAQQPEEMDTSW